jgi:Uma2 family endonuclease
MVAQVTRRRFTVQEYHLMGESGVLAADDRVELIDGEVFSMSPIGSRHAACVTTFNEVFSESFGRRVTLWIQNPIRLGDDSEPVPDIVLLRRRDDRYVSRHPRAGDILLLVEIADSSLGYDREIKLPLYAREGVPEVWLANLDSQHIVVYTEPKPDGYASARIARPGEAIIPTAFPEMTIAVADLLP